MKRNIKAEYISSMNNMVFSQSQKTAMVQDLMVRMEETNMKKQTISSRKLFLIAATAVILLGCLTGAAAFTRWSKGAQQLYSPNQEEKEYAESVGLSTLLDGESDTSSVSATDQGITITATQSIVDHHSAQLFFQIDGFVVPDGEEPQIQIGSFGIQDAHVTEPVIVFNEDNDDEALEFMVTFIFENSMDHINKPITIRFIGLGTKTTPALVRGDWVLKWTLSGTDNDIIASYDINSPISNTDYTLLHVEVSPISIYVELTVANDDSHIGNNEEFYDLGRESVFNDIKGSFVGVRTKDGSIHTDILIDTGFYSMYSDEGMRIYYPLESEKLITNNMVIVRYCTLLNRIIDPSQIDAFVFLDPEGLTDDEYIIVPIR